VAAKPASLDRALGSTALLADVAALIEASVHLAVLGRLRRATANRLAAQLRRVALGQDPVAVFFPNGGGRRPASVHRLYALGVLPHFHGRLR
jgi:hypothetical protein